MIGIIPDKESLFPTEPNVFDRIFERIGRIETPSARSIITGLAQLLMLISPRSQQALASDPAKSFATCFQGVALLTLAAIAHGLAVSLIGKPALGRFMSVNRSDIDFLVGFCAALVFILVAAVVIYGFLRILRLRAPFIVIVASLGFALTPLTPAMLLLSIIPLDIKGQTASVLFPSTLIWALGYLVIDFGSSVIHGERLKAGMPTLIVAAILAYYVGGYLVNQAHQVVLRHVRIPLVEMRDNLSDEFPNNMRPQVNVVLSNLHSVDVDMVDVSADDFVGHLFCAKKASKRFCQTEETTDELWQIRIRSEVTSNAGRMRRLYPRMAKVTRSRKTADDVVQSVSEWLQATLIKVEPATYPFGEKFQQDPLTTLISKRGDQVDASILMISALRASGVAARSRPVYPDEYATDSYVLAEYFDGREWKSCFPKVGRIQKPPVRSEDLAALAAWAEDNVSSRRSLYVLVDGMWCPYSTGGRVEPAGFSLDLAPGTYLASYIDGETCRVRKFVLRPSKQKLSQ